MTEPRRVEVAEYVRELRNLGVRPIAAVKTARIFARPGVEGEIVKTWSVKDGQPYLEKEDSVTIDPETGKPGYVVTKLDENGQKVIDEFGHDNTWIIEYPKFHKKYVPSSEMGERIYKPVGGVQVFLPVLEDIIIYQWGKEMVIGRGGYINITNPEDMYGISERDFTDTYRTVPTTPEMTKKLGTIC